MLDYTFKYMFFLFLFFIVGSRWPTMTKPNLHKSNIISFVQTTKYYTYWTVNQNRTIDRCLEWECDTDKTALKTQILLKFFILSSYHPEHPDERDICVHVLFYAFNNPNLFSSIENY